MQIRFVTAILTLLLSLDLGVANAQVYRWVDKDGKVQYGDTAPSQSKATRLTGAARPLPPMRDTGQMAAKIPAAGIVYLADSGTGVGLVGKSPFDNSAVDGLVLRTSWAELEFKDNAYDWNQIDANLQAAVRTGKAFGLAAAAGFGSPDWFLTSGATTLTVTHTNPVNGRQARVAMPVPWDPAFQAKWGEFLQVVAARYDGQRNFSYVVISGVGQSFEAIMARSPEDVAAFEAMGGLPRWIAGAKAVIDLYAKHFRNTPFVLSMHYPVISAEGELAIADVVNYGLETYPGRFGVKYDGLDAIATNPPFFYRTISDWSDRTAVGFQMVWSTVGTHADWLKGSLGDVLARGVARKAHFIEVYAVDCNNPLYAGALKQASAGLKQNRAALKL